MEAPLSLSAVSFHQKCSLALIQFVGAHRDLIRPDQLTQMGEQEAETFCRGAIELSVIAPGDHVNGAAG